MIEPMSVEARHLFVAQQFSDRSIRPVGRLSIHPAESAYNYEFVYLNAILGLDEFSPFLAFPDVEHRYTSATLFPFFENRIMGVHRPEYPELLDALDLESHAEPFEVLARSGGTRETDHIEVFPQPERDPSTGNATCRFFVRGVQYLDGAAEAILSLAKGETLRFVSEPGNPYDREAIVVTTADGFRLGYLPRYLTTYVAEALRSCDPGSVHLQVAKVGDPSMGFHTRLMVEFTSCWLDLDWPFAEDIFSPLHPVLV